jgi:hypothetical protein
MKYLFFVVVIIILASCGGGTDQEKGPPSPGTVSTPVTVQVDNLTLASVASALEAYYQLKDALVEADTVAANIAALQLSALANSIKTEGISDSALCNTIRNLAGTIASEAISLPQEEDITEKRRSFSMITENLYPLLQSVQYHDGTVYQQMCPMAFNDTETAYWLSSSSEVVNPYLGKKHPKYSAGMLHCGEVKDSLTYRK